MAVSREATQAKLDLIAAGAVAHSPSQIYTVADRFEEKVAGHGDAPFIIYDDQVYSYSRINSDANRIAHLMLAQGIVCGDVVALMMENRPEFISSWLGLAKLGATIALINPNTREIALRHAIESTNCKLILAGSECTKNLGSVALNVSVNLVSDSNSSEASTHMFTNVDEALTVSPCENPPRAVRETLTAGDPLFYIFTSGTTGRPKAARLSHMRWLGVGDSWKGLMQPTSNSVFYCVLPLYHGAAGMSLCSPALASGASIVLKRRFSASQFWNDVHQYHITNCQYIGEICRYLLNQPARPDDPENSLQYMMGAGLGADIWENFQTRFDISHIYEGWGATESNCAISNVDNKVGSCGRIPFKDRSNVRLVRYDVERDCHITNPNGTLVECGTGEAGELIGLIAEDPNVGAGRFEGYTDPKATESKILRNVFKRGDAWFRSGDLLRRDEEDYYYFVDRIGDTFRWKSENVSTQEVAEALSSWPGLKSINVYGVKVPGQDGRAGMASLVLADHSNFNAQDFFQFSAERLPKYAVPLFLRLSPQSELTATFKLRKVDLQREGYDMKQVRDPLFVRSEAQGSYLPMTATALAQLDIPPFEKN